MTCHDLDVSFLVDTLLDIGRTSVGLPSTSTHGILHGPPIDLLDG